MSEWDRAIDVAQFVGLLAVGTLVLLLLLCLGQWILDADVVGPTLVVLALFGALAYIFEGKPRIVLTAIAITLGVVLFAAAASD